MNRIERIQEKMPYFTKTEVEIANYILNNAQQFITQPIEETVNRLNVSKPAMIRFAKKLNYQGYSQLKFDLTYFVSNTQSLNQNCQQFNTITATISLLTDYLKSFEINIDAAQLTQLAHHIIKAKRCKIFAYHKSGATAHLLKMSVAKLGIDIDVLSDPFAIMDCIAYLNEDDLVLIYTIQDKFIFDTLIPKLSHTHIPSALISLSSTYFTYPFLDYRIILPSLYNTQGYVLDDQLVFIIYNQLLLNEINILQTEKVNRYNFPPISFFINYSAKKFLPF